MVPIAVFDRFDIAVCGVVAVLIVSAYGITKRDTSELIEIEPRLTYAEKVMVWASIAMFSMILVPGVVHR